MIDRPLIVLDTMVVVSGIMGRIDASDARTLESIETGRVQLALSDEWLRELQAVLIAPPFEFDCFIVKLKPTNRSKDNVSHAEFWNSAAFWQNVRMES